MNPLLAILVPTVTPGRDPYLAKLQACLAPQLTEQIVVLTEPDQGENRGGLTTGAKRNILVQRAAAMGAQYVMHVDDDDLLVSDALLRITMALEGKPDVVGIIGEMIVGDRRKTFIHSINYHAWFERDGILYRCPNHLNPLKTEIAVRVPFPSRTFGEDRAFSQALYVHLKYEVMILATIYEYHFRRDKPEMAL